MPNIQIIRPGFAQGYNKQSLNKSRFVVTDAELKKLNAIKCDNKQQIRKAKAKRQHKD